jgi:tryptophan-rich sensory protein
MQNINFTYLAIAIIIPVLGGFLSGYYGMIGKNKYWYNSLQKPRWNPPSWIFAPVWTTLYIMMGIASYLVWEKGGSLLLYAAQLVANLAWSPVFFRTIGKEHRIDIALYIIIALWVLIAATIQSFYNVSKMAALFMIPYFLWVTYAVSLNWYIVRETAVFTGNPE